MLLTLEEATRRRETLMCKKITHPYGISQAILMFDGFLLNKFSVLRPISYSTNGSEKPGMSSMNTGGIRTRHN